MCQVLMKSGEHKWNKIHPPMISVITMMIYWDFCYMIISHQDKRLFYRRKLIPIK